MKIQERPLSRDIVLKADEANRESFELLVNQLTPTFKDFIKLVNGRITLEDNLKCAVRSFTFTYPETYQRPTFVSGVTDFNGDVEGTVRFYKKDGWVQISGLAAATYSSTPQNILTVPEDCFPVSNESAFAGTVDFKPAVYTLNKDSGVLTLNYTSASAGSGKAYRFNHKYLAADPFNIPPGNPFPLVITIKEFTERPTRSLVLRCTRQNGKNVWGMASPNMVWDTSTDGRNPCVKIKDFEGLAPGYKYNVSVVFFP